MIDLSPIDPAFPKAARNYWKAQFLIDPSDDAIRTLIAGFRAATHRGPSAERSSSTSSPGRSHQGFTRGSPH
jgi:hypothetical protein